jgi:hypothetical protein
MEARRSLSPARFGYVEACSIGLVNASFIALKGLLGFRTGKQTNHFAIANSAGKSFAFARSSSRQAAFSVWHNCRAPPIARRKQAAKSQRA